MPKHPRGRKSKSGGNAFIEMALVLVPTMALILAYFDFSLALFRWSTIQNAVREGCRYAITFQTTGHGQDAAIEAVVAANSMGLVTVTDNPMLIFVNYFTPLAPNTAIAAPNGNVPGNIVEVSIVGYTVAQLAPLSGTIVNPLRTTSPLSISVYSSDVLGGYPAGVTGVQR
jgi:Flp pilus assembly protein TadG